MKLCGNCGYKMIDDLKYCPECGAAQTQTEEDNNAKQYDTSRQKILIDYYEKIIATPQDMPDYELILYTFDDKQLILEEYRNENCVQKLVPFAVYEKAMEVVRTFHLKDLIDRKGSGLNGKTYVIRFRESINDKDLYRFSDENVGEKETIMMFSQMRQVLSA